MKRLNLFIQMPPQFEAVPVRDLSKPLTQGGAFQAGVTIKLDYQ